MKQAKDGSQYIVTLCVQCDTDWDDDYTESAMLEQIADLVDRTYGWTCPVSIEEVEVEDEDDEDYEGEY
jgi:hypothetical protein